MLEPLFYRTVFFSQPLTDFSTARMDGYNGTSSIQLFLILEEGCYCAGSIKAVGLFHRPALQTLWV